MSGHVPKELGGGWGWHREVGNAVYGEVRIQEETPFIVLVTCPV